MAFVLQSGLLAHRRGRQPAALPRRDRVPGDRRQPGAGPGAGVRRRRPDRHVRPERGRPTTSTTTTSRCSSRTCARRRTTSCSTSTSPSSGLEGGALRADPGGRQAGPDRRHLRRVLRAGQRPVLARPGRLPRGHRLPRSTTPTPPARRSRRRRPPTARSRSTTRPRRPARPRRSPTSCSRRGATSASTSRSSRSSRAS